MKRCLACHQKKPDDQFPSPGSLTCNFCTPSSGRLSSAVMYGKPKLAAHNDRMQADPKFAQYHDLRTQRATRHDDSVAKMLLQNASKPRVIGMDETVDISSGKERFVVLPKNDERPLIDRLHEATFHDPVGLQWIKDKYALRTIIRKAHCFTLDNITSALVADFSLAIAPDLESARQLAIPPFPVTWIDLNNEQRIKRIHELGVPLTPQAQGITDAGAVVPRVGWLIHPADIGGWYATYCCVVEQVGVTIAPLSYWWHAGPPNTAFKVEEDRDHFMQRLTFGIANANVNPADAYPSVTPLHIELLKHKNYSQQVTELMTEIGGELRHIWGLLIALGAGRMQLGAEARLTPQPTHSDVRTMPNGKPLLPLEHKILHLHLGKKTPPKVLIAKAIFHHRKRLHDVRAHFRLLKSGRRVSVKAHTRGDEKLGRIEKTYKVER